MWKLKEGVVVSVDGVRGKKELLCVAVVVFGNLVVD